MAQRLRDARPALFVIAILVIIADRLSKLWIVAHINAYKPVVVIPHIFRITNVRNTGAAFSMFESFSPEVVRNGLIAFSVIAVLIVIAVVLRTGRILSAQSVAFALILGGAIGNLYDRIHFHYVVDFLEVTIVRYHWPDFNVADSCIVTGACLLFLVLLLPQKTRP